MNEKHSPIPEHYSQFLQELINSLLEKNEADRPTIEEILEKAEIVDEVRAKDILNRR